MAPINPDGSIRAELDSREEKQLEVGLPLLVSQIICHKKVTQCLGVLGKEKDFYLVMHHPCDDGISPTVGGLQAFRIPLNLELANTNIVDLVTLQLTDVLREITVGLDMEGVVSSMEKDDMDIQSLFHTEADRKVEIPIFPVPSS